MTSSYPITGIPLPTALDPKHPIPIRQEIDAWYSNPDNAIQVSLFIQALEKFMKTDYREKLSYYQVAGIHGQPWTSWDGVDGGQFCSHNTSIFPTWHRPYVLLVEQRLYEIMLKIIEGIPGNEKDLWKMSASHWRLPYWDWAVKSKFNNNNYGVPKLLTLKQVEIKLPHTLNHMDTKIVDNPLWQFTNPAGIAMGHPSMKPYALQYTGPNDQKIAYWLECVATSKFGIFKKLNPADWIYGVQNWEQTNNALQHPQWYDPDIAGATVDLGSIGEAVYRMFCPGYLKSWDAFASTLYDEKNPGTNFLSVEYIHNNIHGFVGGDDPKTTGLGHMSDVGVAAFDPIFWLHHCNVDRQIAIWQTLNPDKWFDSPIEGDDGPTASLKPFHVNAGKKLWDSNMARDWTKWNYQYDSLEPPQTSFNDHGELNRDLYLPGLKKSLNEKYSDTRHELLRDPSMDGNKNDYIVNIVYDRYALDGQSYTIYFFLGTVEGEVNSYALHPNQVGSVYTFSSGFDSSNDLQCANCKDQKEKGVLSTAQIHLTVPLLKHARDQAKRGFETLRPIDVSNYLARNLHWKVAVMGEAVDMDQLPKTKIYVLQGTAEHSTDDSQLSSYHDYKPMWEACAGKPGAAREADGLE